MDNKIFEQLKVMKDQMDRFYQEVLSKKVSVESPSGYFRITVNGKKDIENIEIAPGILSREQSAIFSRELKETVNNALRKVEEMTTKELGHIAQGMNMEDFF